MLLLLKASGRFAHSLNFRQTNTFKAMKASSGAIFQLWTNNPLLLDHTDATVPVSRFKGPYQFRDVAFAMTARMLMYRCQIEGTNSHIVSATER